MKHGDVCVDLQNWVSCVCVHKQPYRPKVHVHLILG